MTQRNKHLVGWSPVAGNVGRPDLRRDAVEPNQRGFTRTIFLSTTLASVGCPGGARVSPSGCWPGRSSRQGQCQVMSAKEIAALAALPSREELIARLLGAMQAPIIKFVRTLNEIPSRFVRTLAAVRDAKPAS